MPSGTDRLFCGIGVCYRLATPSQKGYSEAQARPATVTHLGFTWLRCPLFEQRCYSLLRVQGLPIIEPMLVLAEVAGVLSRTRQDPARAQTFATALGHLQHVTVVPCDTALGQRALEPAAQHGLRGADAVYAAVARHAACILISLDNKHLTRLTDIVRVQTPEDALAEPSPPLEEAPASCPSC